MSLQDQKLFGLQAIRVVYFMLATAALAMIVLSSVFCLVAFISLLNAELLNATLFAVLMTATFSSAAACVFARKALA